MSFTYGFIFLFTAVCEGAVVSVQNVTTVVPGGHNSSLGNHNVIVPSKMTIPALEKIHMEELTIKDSSRFGHKTVRKQGVTMSQNEKHDNESVIPSKEEVKVQNATVMDKNNSTNNASVHANSSAPVHLQSEKPHMATVVAVEGGGKVSLTVQETANSTSKSDSKSQFTGSTTSRSEVSSTTNKSEISSTTNKSEISSTTNKSEISSTTNKSEISSTTNKSEISSTTTKSEVRKIHPRKGVNYTDFLEHLSKGIQLAAHSTPPPLVHSLPPVLGAAQNVSVVKKKPLYTMVVNDKAVIESDSFIESSTTGKDYVFPIVLAILIFPILLITIKVIYKRGTEFTERQQYHRMYLIDGMYNSR